MNETRNNLGRVCALASGGLDSGVMLALLARRCERVFPLYVRCGLAWEGREWAALEAFVARLGCPQVQPPQVMDFPMADLYGEHWSTTGRGVPDAATPDEAVYLPGRNLVLLTKAAVFCGLHHMEAVALGPLASNPFPDASEAFFRSFERTASTALDMDLAVLSPLAKYHKKDVITLGKDLPLELTFSCLTPVGGLHCGRCNKCHERIAAFGSAAVADPTGYAD